MPVSLDFRDALRAIGDELGVPVIRRHTLMREWLDKGELTPDELLSPDGLHMADGGYAKLAETIAAEIVPVAATKRLALDAAPVQGGTGRGKTLP